MTSHDALDQVADRVSELLELRIGLRTENGMRGRLRRGISDEAAAQGLDPQAYLRTVVARGPAFQSLLNRITVQETSFFRHPTQFEVLARDVLPTLVPPVRIWSVGCANGQEAFSIAMIMQEQGCPGAVIATDLSTDALRRTDGARYSEREISGLSPDRLARHMVRNGGGGWQIAESLRARVTTLRHNLLDDIPDQVRSCQVVVCRNVLIYVSSEHARSFLDRMADGVDPAALFLGSAETICSVSDRFDAVCVGDTFVYRPRSDAGTVHSGRSRPHSLHAGRSTADSVHIGRPSAGSVRTGQASADSVHIGRPSAGSVRTGQASADSVHIGRPSAGSVRTGQPSADSVHIGQSWPGSVHTGRSSAPGAAGDQPDAPTAAPAWMDARRGAGATRKNAGSPNAAPPPAAQNDSDAAILLATAGEHALAAGDHRGAVVMFRKWACLTPDDAMAHLHLGLALEVAGDPGPARRAFLAARRAATGADPVPIERAIEGYATAELLRLLDAKEVDAKEVDAKELDVKEQVPEQ
jgi:chemotaxis protein methyltransferase CheR